MTSTNIHIGLSENSRSSSKVLKPPGGGSSDIFGNGTTSATPRSNKGHMASNIFAAPLEKTVNAVLPIHITMAKQLELMKQEKQEGVGFSKSVIVFVEHSTSRLQCDNHRRNPNMDSHNRLFGEVERPYTPAKNHFKSNIPLGAADSPDAAPKTNGNTNGKANGTNGHTNGVSKVSNGEAMLANGNSVKHELNDCPLTNNSNSSSIEEIISPRSPRNERMNYTPRRNIYTPPDNLPIQPIEINTNVQVNGTAPLTNTTNSSSFSSSTDDSNFGFAKSPRLAQRNPVTGLGIQDTFQRGRKMDGRRDGNPVTGHGYTTEINTAVPALNGTKQVINKNRIPPGGFSSGLW